MIVAENPTLVARCELLPHSLGVALSSDLDVESATLVTEEGCTWLQLSGSLGPDGSHAPDDLGRERARALLGPPPPERRLPKRQQI